MDEDTLKEFIKEGVKKSLKPTLEEVFEKTMELTTPEQAGDIRQSRKYQDAWTKDELDEWV